MSTDFGYKLPPQIATEVQKPNLDIFSVKVPPVPTQRDVWSEAKDLISQTLDAAASDIQKLQMEKDELKAELFELKCKLDDAAGISRTFDTVFDEMFGVETFPHVRKAFKQKLGI